MLELEQVSQWDEELTRLVREAQADHRDVLEVPLPSSLSATSLVRAARPTRTSFARELARPMPRRPSAVGALRHPVPRLGREPLRPARRCLDPDDLPGRGDSGIDDDADLAELIERFEAGPFADRHPLEVEPSFALVLAGQVVRGSHRRRLRGGRRRRTCVVDWKTNRAHTADPLQLAVYRVAWAELHRLPLRAGPGRVLLRPRRRAGVAGRPPRPGRARGAARRRRGQLTIAVSATSTMWPKVSWRSCGRGLLAGDDVSETVQIASALRPYFAASV